MPAMSHLPRRSLKVFRITPTLGRFIFEIVRVLKR